MSREEITEQDILRVQKEINSMWADIEEIFEGEESEDKVWQLGSYLDEPNMELLIRKYQGLPPAVILYLNQLFQVSVSEFLLKVVKRKQLEQLCGD